MDSCDVLIVGGGPAGSSCAWGLRRAGLDVAILDRSEFPRDKVCGGWITPAVVQELQIDFTEYARGRVLQPITGFRTSRIGGPEVETDYAQLISYGIRRREFDDYLLRRSGGRILAAAALKSMERAGDSWIVNSEIRARLIVGAGGHFCPVARFLGADAKKEVAVAAQECEFEMSEEQRAQCAVRGEIPELFFCDDMKGYGWCFRKGNFLNVGLGRLDPHALPGHVAKFVEYVKRAGKIGFDISAAMLGHAYVLYRQTKRRVVDDGVMLIGDAAGLAYSQSGEGIRPAIESGLLAAQAIGAAAGVYSAENLERYRALLASRFGSNEDWATAIGARLPSSWIKSLGKLILANRWFSRHVVLDRWFLHRTEPALIV